MNISRGLLNRSLLKKFYSQISQKKESNLLTNYDPIEFEAFKFEQEKEKFYSGYSLTDLYGKNKVLAISPTLRKEMMTDNIYALLILFLAMLYINEKRRRVNEFKLAYEKYRNYKLSYNPYK